MSACPIGDASSTSDFSTPATFQANPPDTSDESCNVVNQHTTVGGGADTVITGTTVCAGPQGPTGIQGTGFDWEGPWADSTQYYAQNISNGTHGDVVLGDDGISYICIVDHTSDSSTEPGSGGSPENSWATRWEKFVVGGAGGGLGNVIWRQYWLTGVNYAPNDMVSHNGYSYVCIIGHTSNETNEPDPEFDFEPGGNEWYMLSAGQTPEEKDLIDQALDGVWDWLGDIENWGTEDWLLALAGGAGLIWAGSALNDMFSEDGEGDGEADSVYNGDPLYTTAFTSPYLPDVCSKVCDWVGITQYDVSLLPNIEINSTIGSLTPGRSVLDLLSRVYFFDMVDSSGTLKFIPRGNPTSIRTLTEDVDLGWTKAGSMPPPPVSIKRYQNIDLPRRVELQYKSEAIAHNAMVQTATLETFSEGQDIKISLPFTITDQEAYEIAEKTIVNSHIERMNYGFTTTYKHIDLEPGDIVTVENIGDVRILRIEEDREAGLLTFSCVDAAFNSDNYESSGMAAEPPQSYDDAPIQLGYSAGLTVELPPLDSSDTDQRLTIAPHGYGKAGWPGAVAYVSLDGGTSYSSFETATQEATWGKVSTATPDVASGSPATGTYHTWDETTTIQVELKTGTLSSLTKAEVVDGFNWALIGDEIIGFETATLVSGTTYNLSGLLRGRRGTDYYTDKHVNDEAFILLDDSLIEYEYPIDQKDKVFYFKFVTVGSDISKATAYTAQPSQKSRRPWRVGNLNATQSANDWNITWYTRNQFDGEMKDSGPVDNPDMFGGFSIQVIVPGSPEEVKRTITQQKVDYVYTEAQQIEDFGSVQSSITIRISQIDRTVGPGYDTTQTFGA